MESPKSEYQVSLRSQKESMELEQEVEAYILNYQSKIKTIISPLEKIRCIAEVIQDLEQKHPFDDVNCRTICMLTLNHLLLQNGFPLAILKDANRFDAYSIDELIEEIIKGMENTFELIETGRLFGISTDEIINYLKSDSKFAYRLAQFEKLTAGEEKNQTLLKRINP
jgi:hypothetical protein